MWTLQLLKIMILQKSIYFNTLTLLSTISFIVKLTFVIISAKMNIFQIPFIKLKKQVKK